MNNELETARQLYARSSKALLEIERLGYNINNVLQSNISPEAKVEVLARLNNDILNRVMEGTSSLYGFEKNS